MSSEKLTFQPPHSLNPREKEYLQQADKKEKELHKLASQMFGSSHFEGKTHGYRIWESKQKEKR